MAVMPRKILLHQTDLTMFKIESIPTREPERLRASGSERSGCCCPRIPRDRPRSLSCELLESPELPIWLLSSAPVQLSLGSYASREARSTQDTGVRIDWLGR